MTDQKHTPGPWEVSEQSETSLVITTADGNWRICFMATPGDSPGAMERIEADANLIAAAPALLEGLTKYMLAVELMNAAMRDGINVQGAVSMLVGAEAIARDALAKAAS